MTDNLDPEITIHKVSYESELGGLWPCVRARCTCGATWTHPEGVTESQKLSIFQSHLGYAKRVAMRAD